MSQNGADREVVRVKDSEELSQAAVGRIIQDARSAIGSRGRFVIALAGGSTPKRTYQHLAEPQNAAKIDWGKVYAFLGDERFVPPADERSNFGMARENLLSRVPIPEANIFPVPTDRASPIESAMDYEKTLRAFFGPGADPPRFDLILLGMGDDGHTASLFPNAATIGIRDRWVVSSPAGTLPPPVDRITFTYTLLNAARRALFLVSGERKAAALADIFENHPNPLKRPSAGVLPTAGTVTWLIDDDAAKDLNEPI